MELLKAAATKVGKQLGHVTRDAKTGTMSVSPGTSSKNYIDPTLQLELFRHFNAPMPTYLEKMLSVDRSIQSAVSEEEDTDEKPTEEINRLLKQFLNGDQQGTHGTDNYF
jgi:hypothetical protein